MHDSLGRGRSRVKEAYKWKLGVSDKVFGGIRLTSVDWMIV